MDSPRHPDDPRPSGRDTVRIVAITAGTAVLMLAFESGKQLLVPDISIWQSHFATIAFTTLLAPLLAMEDAQHRQRRRTRLWPLLLIVLGATAGVMLVFETAKQLLLPKVSLWQSHVITICFSSILAALAAYLVGRRVGALNERLESLVHQVSEELARAEHSREALRASEEKFLKAFQASPDCIVITRLDGQVIEVNDRFETILGYTREELIGRRGRDLNIFVDPDAGDRMRAKLVKEGALRDQLYEFRRKSGEIGVMQVSLEPMEVGGIPCILSVHRDITTAKLLETRLQQAQKMEAVGRLAAGVAHDFNNILTVILGNCESAISGTGGEAGLAVALADIQSAATRAAALTQQLLAFSRQQMIHPTVLDLNRELSTLQRMLSPLVGEDVRLELALGRDVPNIRIDPGQFNQIVMNLAANARDAMPKGGKLLIETLNARMDEKLIERHREMPPGHYVLLAISDTGIGMNSAVQSHLFEPFFTTKEQGKGTGLGLATVYGIVKQNGGFIWVYSEQGAGSTFKMYFPAAEDEPAPEPPAATRIEPTAGDETVLLVEDEDALRSLLTKQLERAGYRVITAENGNDALGICAGSAQVPALLITDVVMPGMSGRELADQLLTIYPALRVLYLSGYTDEAVLRHGILPSGSFFLQKPFAMHSFLAKVREILTTQ